VKLHQLANERQSNPQSSRALVPIADLCEEVEDMRQHVFRYADARVGDTHADFARLSPGGNADDAAPMRQGDAGFMRASSFFLTLLQPVTATRPFVVKMN
jgi:hypothetical protein